MLALCVLGLSGFVYVSARGISATTFGVVGPQVFPNILAGLLAVLGVLMLIEALTGRWRSDEIAEHQPRPLLLVGLGLGLDIVLMRTAGFVLASTALFVCVAMAFGSRRILRDGIVGLVLAGLAYLLFTRVLLLNLPAGSIWN